MTIVNNILSEGIWFNKYARIAVNAISVSLTLFLVAYTFVVVSMGTSIVGGAIVGTVAPEMEPDDLAIVETIISVIPLFLGWLSISILHGMMDINLQRVLTKGERNIASYWAVGMASAYIVGVQSIWSQGIGAGLTLVFGAFLLSAVMPIVYSIKTYIFLRRTKTKGKGTWIALSRFVPIAGPIFSIIKFRQDIKYLILLKDEEEPDDRKVGEHGAVHPDSDYIDGYVEKDLCAMQKFIEDMQAKELDMQEGEDETPQIEPDRA